MFRLLVGNPRARSLRKPADQSSRKHHQPEKTANSTRALESNQELSCRQSNVLTQGDVKIYIWVLMIKIQIAAGA